MDDPDVCLQNLEAAKISIANANAINNSIKENKAIYQKEADAAYEVYQIKLSEQITAQNDVENIKSSQSKYVNCSDGCSWGDWPDGTCQTVCESNMRPKYSEGATINSMKEHESGCCLSKVYSCSCLAPDVNEYNKRISVRDVKRGEADTKKAIWLAKKKTLDDYKPTWAMAPINLACCINEVSCAPGADCGAIEQKCEAKINTAKEAAKKKDSLLVGEKKTNSISSTDSTGSSSNIIDNRVLSFSCSCIIIIIITITITIIIIKKKK
jgi:hypothetical protein